MQPLNVALEPAILKQVLGTAGELGCLETVPIIRPLGVRFAVPVREIAKAISFAVWRLAVELFGSGCD